MSIVKWERLSAACDRAAWDQAMLQSQDYNVFQSFLWGEYKRAGGWTPTRWIGRDQSGSTVAMGQILVKTYPGKVTIGWAPAGPIMRFAATPQRNLASIIKSLTNEIAPRGRTIIRFDNYLPLDASLEFAMQQASLVRPYVTINTGHSLLLDLLQPLEALSKQIRPRHRSYIKNALNKGIEWKAGRGTQEVQELVSLHDEMTTQKKLSLRRIGTYEVSSLCDILGEQATVFTGYLDNKAITSTLVLNFGEKAFYFIGASGTEGRTLRASYGLIDQLLRYLKAEGIVQFDFGGLNPHSATTAGVDQFKKGFGGEPVKHLGEWEWASHAWLRWGLNFALWQRGSGL